MPDTGNEIISDIVKFIPHKIPLPIPKVTDHMTMAIDTIAKLLSENLQDASPTYKTHKYLQLQQGFRQISDILKNDDFKPPPRVQLGY